MSVVDSSTSWMPFRITLTSPKGTPSTSSATLTRPNWRRAPAGDVDDAELAPRTSPPMLTVDS